MAPYQSNTNNTCIKCRKVIPNRDYLRCCECKNLYDIECAKVSEKHYQSMLPDKKLAFKCHVCMDSCMKSADAACSSRQGTTSQPVGNERKAKVSPHVTRSKTRSTEQLATVTTSVAGAPAEVYITEVRLTEILKKELGTTIKEQVSGHLSMIQDQMTSFHDSFTYFNSQFEEMRQRMDEKDKVIEQLKEENAQLHSTVGELASRLGNMEQQMRENNLEINGIPERHTENLVKTVVDLANKVDSSITEDEIVHVTRVAKINKDNKKPRAVIVKLRSPRQRDTILAAVSTYNKKNPKDKLNSQHLGIGGDKSPVFLSEHLSPANKHLHAATRQLAKEMRMKFVWVRNGRIFVRKDEFSQALIIKSFENLEQLKKASQPV